MEVKLRCRIFYGGLVFLDVVSFLQEYDIGMEDFVT